VSRVLDIIESFEDEFLRCPTITDTQRLLAKAEKSGFLSMLGSIDYIHWKWHNCPIGWQGQFIRGTSNILQSSLKLLLLMIVVSGILFLKMPVPTMTSMCSINLHCLLIS
jgi:hypothetical protein